MGYSVGFRGLVAFKGFEESERWISYRIRYPHRFVCLDYLLRCNQKTMFQTD